jgi:hypothetical protein
MTLPGIYSQRDATYSSDELGFNTDSYYNIYHFGCLISGIAELLWVMGHAEYNPREVNNWLKGNNGFVDGGLVVWSAADTLIQNNGATAHGVSYSKDDVNNFLQDENNFAIVWLSKQGFPMHWGLAPFVNTLADPWDGTLKSLDGFVFHAAHLYSRNVATAPVLVPVTVPTPEAQVISLPPLVDPAPLAIPTNTTPQLDPNPAPISVTTPVGEVLVTPPIIPALPEFRTSFIPFAGNSDTEFNAGAVDYILTKDTQAVDMEGINPPKSLQAGQRIKLSGEFNERGEDYYRGTSEVFYGIPKSAFDNGQPHGAIKIKVPILITLEEFGVEFAQFAVKRFGVFKRLARFLGFSRNS